MTPPAHQAARGRLITFEGPEGAGKTTQALGLRDALATAGLICVLTREPGGTILGERIRAILMEHDPESPQPDPRADALLFNTARAQLVVEVIRPALERGDTVIATRFADSTLAYQGYGAGLPLDELRALERFATGGVRPDLTILLDLPVEIGLARKTPGEVTRFEAGFDIAFHRRVRAGFLALAGAEPDRYVVVPADDPPEVVAAAVRAAVSGRLGIDVGGASTSGTAKVEPEVRHVRITS